MEEQKCSIDVLRLAQLKGCTLNGLTIGSDRKSMSFTKTISQSLMEKWIREKYKIYITVFEEFGKHFLLIHYYEEDGSKAEIWKHKGGYKTKEQAMDIGLLESLKLIRKS